MRNPKHGDFKIKVMNNESVQTIKTQFLDKSKQSAHVRLFMNGQELKDDHSVFYYNLSPDNIVHAFLRYD